MQFFMAKSWIVVFSMAGAVVLAGVLLFFFNRVIPPFEARGLVGSDSTEGLTVTVTRSPSLQVVHFGIGAEDSRWEVPFEQKGAVSASFVGLNRVILQTNSSLTALHAKNGQVVWREPGRFYQVLIVSKYVAGIEYVDDGRGNLGRYLTVLDAEFGGRAASAKLSKFGDERLALFSIGSCLILASQDIGNEFSYVFPLSTLRLSFVDGRGFVAGRNLGEDLVLLSRREIIRYSHIEEKVLWGRQLNQDGYAAFVSGDVVVDRATGIIGAIRYRPHADTGVAIATLASNGDILWQKKCLPTLIIHTEYSHRAWMEISQHEVMVISVGNSHSVLERRSLSDGELKVRLDSN